MRPRYTFIDWCRGLACVLMFQTHVYDSYTAEAYRHGWFWDLVHTQLGGMPSRLFLFLAGVSLMLRFDTDRRRGVPELKSRLGATWRGLEVLGLALGFRLFEWVMAGAWPSLYGDLLRVDILNCIGLSLIVGAWVASPRDLTPGRVPWGAAGAAIAVVFVSRHFDRHPPAHLLPAPLMAYLYGAPPMAFFPLLPWLSYLLAGCVAGALWVRNRERLGPAMKWTAAIGLVAAVVAQVAFRSPLHRHPLLAACLGGAAPVSFLYRTGLVLLLCALSYVAARRLDAAPGRHSPILLLGQTSLFVYWIHVELVYGHLSDPFKAQLNPGHATLGLLVVTLYMVGLSRLWLLYRSGQRRAVPVR